MLESADKKTRRFEILLSLFFAASLLIAAFSISWRDVPELLRHVNWLVLPLVGVATVLSYWTGSWSFVYTCRIFSINARASTIWKVGFLSSIADNIGTVGNVGGHSVRVLLLARFDHKKSTTLVASLFDGYFYQLIFISFFPVSLIILALSRNTLPFGAVTLWSLIVLFAGLSMLMTVGMLHHSARRRLLDFIARVIALVSKKDIQESVDVIHESLTQGIRASQKHPAQLRELLILTLIDWVMDVATLGLCFVALGATINPGALLLGFVISMTLGALSFIPGGLGVRDGSMVGIYVLFGVPAQLCILAVILNRLIYSFVPYFISLFIYRDVLKEAAKARQLAP